jgi:hypothetical protein
MPKWIRGIRYRDLSLSVSLALTKSKRMHQAWTLPSKNFPGTADMQVREDRTLGGIRSVTIRWTRLVLDGL